MEHHKHDVSQIGVSKEDQLKTERMFQHKKRLVSVVALEALLSTTVLRPLEEAQTTE